MPTHYSPLQGTNAKPKSLMRVVGQSEKIKVVVDECVDELSSVNLVLKEELNSRPSQQGVEIALQKSEAIEAKVQDCADNLNLVNEGLKGEVRERQALEHEMIQMKAREEAARHDALHDALTSLPNRLLFNDRLEHGLAQAKRHSWTLAVMFIDLDNFKSINDTYGHAAGDFILQTVATRLKNMTRADDTLSRHGGDEFLQLLLELKSAQAAVVIAEKIISTVGEPCVVRVNNEAINYSIKLSIGIAIFPKDGETGDALIACADQAMYRAKRDKTGYAFSS